MKVATEAQKDLKRAVILEALKLVADGIAAMLGSRCEVAVHDVRDLDASILKIVNGHVTGRRAGGSMTNYGLKMLKDKANNLFLDYSATTEDGRQLKSEGLVFRDEDGEPLAMLCINWDTTGMVDFERLRELLQPLTQANPTAGPDETFHEDAGTTLHEIVRKVLDNTGIPVRSMKKEDRLDVVGKLEERGFFMIKGAVSHLARRLCVSKFSIYSYLEEVRGNKRDKELESSPQTTEPFPNGELFRETRSIRGTKEENIP